jgi:dTMP kinase
MVYYLRSGRVRKSTQVRRLVDRLRVQGLEVIETREPGGSPGAEALRQVLLSGAAKALGAETEAMLFAAARADHVENLIRPALERGAWVVCDRFHDSTASIRACSAGRRSDQCERITVSDVKPDLRAHARSKPDLRGPRRVAWRGPFRGRPRISQLAAHRLPKLAENEPDRCVSSTPA